MFSRIMCLLGVGFATSCFAAEAPSGELKDLFFGEALYYAHQGDYFDAIARLDAELWQHYGLDDPELDSFYFHVNQAEFSVGDFELSYRMHRRAGRAVEAVLEGNVDEAVRNEAAYRLARIYFQKDQPVNALHALERIQGRVPDRIRDDLSFLRAQVYMATGRFAEAAKILEPLQRADGYAGFAAYNRGIALLRDNEQTAGIRALDQAGQVRGTQRGTLAIRDKANLVLGSKLLDGDRPEEAKQFLERVRLQGPFSTRALLGSGWADASAERYERALVPWSILAKRNVTDESVQEALLAVPYAYGKLGVYGKAALGYGSALEAFGGEIDKLDRSIKSIREGKFLEALTREELKQDKNWMVKLRSLPEAPETYYLMQLMASHDFQASLQNYLDLEALRKRLVVWTEDLDAYEDLIAVRRAYYEPLLPDIDAQFRRLDSRMRLRMEQRDRLDERLQAMLISPRPGFLATAEERVITERISILEEQLKNTRVSEKILHRIRRLKGLIHWRIHTEYDQRLTDAHQHLRQLDGIVEDLRNQYTSFVRTRQAATQSYQGHETAIRQQRRRVRDVREPVKNLMARQGHMLETMAVNELERRRTRLEEFQIKARFAMADSYDRATKAQADREAKALAEAAKAKASSEAEERSTGEAEAPSEPPGESAAQ
ncbi:tetratricopeptide repeat protein [Thiohalomonas denitrificans]|uniref:tetratricopeptide repeat protein n=1 Tax=Thiohalomonas denitrificans TaxID=415747 RepID=UPI0026EFA4A5|nr:hypothetical protein [Thiohalomonas denitrificans]